MRGGAGKAPPKRKPIPLIPTKPPKPRGSVPVKVEGTPLDLSGFVNMETGAVLPPPAPTDRINIAGKIRIVQLILAGEENQDISDKVVAEGFVLKYSAAAVDRWRNDPEVLNAMRQMPRKALQTGAASTDRRAEILKGTIEALYEHNIGTDPVTGRTFLRQSTVFTDRNGVSVDIKTNAMFQATQIKTMLEAIRDLGALVDSVQIPDDEDTGEDIAANLDAQRLGLSGMTKEQMMASLREAVLEGEFKVEEQAGE